MGQTAQSLGKPPFVIRLAIDASRWKQIFAHQSARRGDHCSGVHQVGAKRIEAHGIGNHVDRRNARSRGILEAAGARRRLGDRIQRGAHRLGCRLDL